MSTSETHVTVRSACLHCAMYIGLAVAGIAALTLLALYGASPIWNGVTHVTTLIWDETSSIWYDWAKILTHDYTSEVRPNIILWVSLTVIAWALCVSKQLNDSNPPVSMAFAIGSLTIWLIASYPALCALDAMLPGDETTWVWYQSIDFFALVLGTLFMIALGLVVVFVISLLVLVALDLIKA